MALSIMIDARETVNAREQDNTWQRRSYSELGGTCREASGTPCPSRGHHQASSKKTRRPRRNFWHSRAPIAGHWRQRLGVRRAARLGHRLRRHKSFEIVFDTVEANRKAGDLRRDSRIAIAIGWDDHKTLQIQGMADEPSGHELECVKKTYFTLLSGVLPQASSHPRIDLLPRAPNLDALQRLRREVRRSIVICDPDTGMITHSTRKHLSDGY